MTTPIWVYGEEMQVDAAGSVIRQILSAAGPETVTLVAPEDAAVRPLGESEDPATQKIWGLGVSPTASVRWRVEGDRALVSAVSTVPLDDGLTGAEPVDGHEEGDRSTVRMWQRYVLGTPLEAGLEKVRYVGPEGEEFVRFVPVGRDGAP